MFIDFLLHTHYYYSNFDLAYCITSSGRGHTIGSPETRSVVSGDPMVWPYPRDVILHTRSSYFNNNVFIIYLFLTLF